jgi:hypothetical protein
MVVSENKYRMIAIPEQVVDVGGTATSLSEFKSLVEAFFFVAHWICMPIIRTRIEISIIISFCWYFRMAVNNLFFICIQHTP